MEKPWMASLVDALQAPPTKKPAPEEPISEEAEFDSPASKRPSVSAPLSDSFAGGIDSHWARPTRPPLEYEGSTYWNESWSDRLLAHAPAIAVVVLFAAAIGTLLFSYRVQVGGSLIRLGEEMSGEPAGKSVISAANTNASMVQPPSPPAQLPSPQPALSRILPHGPSPAPAPATADTATSSALESNNRQEPSQDRLSSDSANSESRDHAQHPPTEDATAGTRTDLDDGEAEYRIAHASLGDARTPEAKARAAGLLWAAVTKGSSDAEIELADVYGRGDGVHRNCQQARILLAAARDRHNPLAEKETAELRVYGCR